MGHSWDFLDGLFLYWRNYSQSFRTLIRSSVLQMINDSLSFFHPLTLNLFNQIIIFHFLAITRQKIANGPLFALSISNHIRNSYIHKEWALITENDSARTFHVLTPPQFLPYLFNSPFWGWKCNLFAAVCFHCVKSRTSWCVIFRERKVIDDDHVARDKQKGEQSKV